METENNQMTAQRDIIADGDINVGDSMITQNVKNMESIFNTNNNITNIYMGLSSQQYEQLKKEIFSEVTEMLKQKKKENIVYPDRDVFIPAMQTLTNKFEREYIRKMFTKLLANSMDKSTKDKVHPSFVEVLKNMDSLDAILFKKLLEKGEVYIKAINPKLGIKGTNRILPTAMPEWYIGIELEGYNMFKISTSLINLNRLGIIELMFDRTAGTEGYNILEKKQELINLVEYYQNNNKHMDLELRSTKSIINITEYGRDLAQVCL